MIVREAPSTIAIGSISNLKQPIIMSGGVKGGFTIDLDAKIEDYLPYTVSLEKYNDTTDCNQSLQRLNLIILQANFPFILT